MARDVEATATAADTRDRREERAAPRASFLFVALHCDAPLLGGARYRLAELDEVVIARATTRTATHTAKPDGRVLTIGIPGTFVSRVHARLLRVQGSWVLVDNESRNGTFLEGERITRKALSDGDVFECGHTLFVFRTVSVPTPEVNVDRPGIDPGAPLVTLLPELEASYLRLGAVARAALPVLLLGESGAGKEVVARAIHDLSKRPGAFVAMNCAAIPQGLLESQLFGHVKGAFSGAVRDELGFFRAADVGTLFLDELGDLPLASQAAFLRALEEGAVVPVGTTRPMPVDVRIVAATNQPLQELVAKRTFREDLLARLSGFTHRLPPLRERMEDLGTIVAELLPKLAGANAERVAFTPETGLRLLAHEWPLNIRELRHCLAAALVISNGAPLALEHVAPSLASVIASRTEAPAQSSNDLKGQLLASLTAHQGNVAAVARSFGKAPAQVHRWMKQLGIDVNDFRMEK